ncbi:MAG: hypothetical protein WDA75_14205, partial [Candidatus Latescibacterota bacterium]
MQIDRLLFSPPTDRLLAWHLRLTLQVPLPSRVRGVEVDGTAIDDWVLLQDDRVVPPVPGASRHGVRKPALHVSSASAGGEFVAGRGTPELAVFYPWQAGSRYQVRLEVEDTAGERIWIEATAEAPESGAFPFAGWRHQRLLRLREPVGLARQREPVEVMLSAYGDECGDWAGELRLGLYDVQRGVIEPVPFQVVRQAQANHTATNRRELCTTAWVVAFVDLAAGGETVLLCAWGRPKATPVD